MKVKILSSFYTNELQNAVNKFCHHKDVVSILTNVIGTDLIATIVYKEYERRV